MIIQQFHLQKVILQEVPMTFELGKPMNLGPGRRNTGLEYNIGSLKFLTSLEYRFDIVAKLKGAVFADAGNIWDITNSSFVDREAKFNGISSLSDFAIGTGFGVRYDLNFLILRFDIGFKTHEPYLKKISGLAIIIFQVPYTILELTTLFKEILERLKRIRKLLVFF